MTLPGVPSELVLPERGIIGEKACFEQVLRYIMTFLGGHARCGSTFQSCWVGGMITKADCLEIELSARSAVGRKYSCSPISCKLCCGGGRPHEFDVYAQGVVIGGVSTSPLKTSGGNSNTGGRDRACAELLWLVLWRGTESRIHVLTDKPMASWLVAHFQGIAFPWQITIYHYDCSSDRLVEMGVLYTGQTT